MAPSLGALKHPAFASRALTPLSHSQAAFGTRGGPYNQQAGSLQATRARMAAAAAAAAPAAAPAPVQSQTVASLSYGPSGSKSGGGGGENGGGGDGGAGVAAPGGFVRVLPPPPPPPTSVDEGSALPPAREEEASAAAAAAAAAPAMLAKAGGAVGSGPRVPVGRVGVEAASQVSDDLGRSMTKPRQRRCSLLERMAAML